MEITKREIIASISILAILLIIGSLISGTISEYEQDERAKYHKALKIDDKETFEYSMKTNTGNAFVEGELKAIDTVSYDDLDKQYIKVERVTEEYTMHTRTVTTTVNGKTQTRTEVYWTWDEVGTETKTSKEVTFLGVKFKANQFDLPSMPYITTIKDKWKSDIRYKYYGLEPSFKATIFSNLRNNNITQGDTRVPVYKDMTKEEAYEEVANSSLIPIFWVIWILLICASIYAFMYLDNNWLNND